MCQARRRSKLQKGRQGSRSRIKEEKERDNRDLDVSSVTNVDVRSKIGVDVNSATDVATRTEVATGKDMATETDATI